MYFKRASLLTLTLTLPLKHLNSFSCQSHGADFSQFDQCGEETKES